MALDDRDYVKDRHRKILDRELADAYYNPKQFRRPRAARQPGVRRAGQPPDLSRLFRAAWQWVGWGVTIYFAARWLVNFVA